MKPIKSMKTDTSNPPVRNEPASSPVGISLHRSVRNSLAGSPYDFGGCPECLGTGQVWDNDNGNEDDDLISCPCCMGEGKLWCAMCGKWGNHRSGGCPELTHIDSANTGIE